MNPECNCGRPTTGAWICDRCTTTLEHAIANIAIYWHHLDRAPIGSGISEKRDTTQAFTYEGRSLGGVAISPAVQTRWDAWATVVAWCRVIMEDRPQVGGPACGTPCLHVSCADIRRNRWPGNTIDSMTRYLHRQTGWATTQMWAEAMLSELLDVERRLRRMVDIPAERWFAGKCDTPDLFGNTCGAELYASPEQATITCPGCEYVYGVAERRDQLLEAAKDHHVTATTAAAALLAWVEVDLTAGKLIGLVRQWHDAGQLEVRAVAAVDEEPGDSDRRLYRLGDVQALLVRHAQSRTTMRR